MGGGGHEGRQCEITGMRMCSRCRRSSVFVSLVRLSRVGWRVAGLGTLRIVRKCERDVRCGCEGMFAPQMPGTVAEALPRADAEMRMLGGKMSWSGSSFCRGIKQVLTYTMIRVPMEAYERCSVPSGGDAFVRLTKSVGDQSCELKIMNSTIIDRRLKMSRQIINRPLFSRPKVRQNSPSANDNGHWSHRSDVQPHVMRMTKCPSLSWPQRVPIGRFIGMVDFPVPYITSLLRLR